MMHKHQFTINGRSTPKRVLTGADYFAGLSVIILCICPLFRAVALTFSPFINTPRYECRPHSALNYQTPSEFAARWRNGKCEDKQTDIIS
ncbi:hypothetical protein DC438_18525 [Cronobacter sakazakii]|nr:hypothetical protein DC438_18525 [Cronobacter sakazakii]PUY30722.1 hypothetical protein BS421_09125 [Cronobacter sakazakii]